MTANPQLLEVWGELACFSRPELKVERFSYPVITPSAARGVFDAVFAKPEEFRWQVLAIEVLAPPAYLALRRNEVKEKVNVAAVLDWMDGRRAPEPLLADGDRESTGSDERGRTQRQTMALKNVRYRLQAEIRPWPGHAAKQASLEAQFRRRAERGKCFYQPYLGCREFPAYFRLAPADGQPRISLSQDLGLMLYDVFDLSRPGSAASPPAVSLFHARLEEGLLRVPDYASPEVLKPAEAGA